MNLAGGKKGFQREMKELKDIFWVLKFYFTCENVCYVLFIQFQKC